MTSWELLDTGVFQDDVFFEMDQLIFECNADLKKLQKRLKQTQILKNITIFQLLERSPKFFKNLFLLLVKMSFANQLSFQKHLLITILKSSSKKISTFIANYQQTKFKLNLNLIILNIKFKFTIEQRIGDAAFLSYYQLKREMISDLNHLTRTIQEKMFSFPEHCFNFIKRCPFCNEIWMKVTNCNEKITVCGYIPGLDEQENLQQQTEKYNFYFQGNELKYQKVPIQEQKIINKSIKQQLLSCLSKIGCRRQFNWNEAAPLTPGQKRELLDTEVFDFLAMEVTQIQFDNQYQKQLQKETINQKQQQKYLKSIEEEMKRVVIKQL